jgi:DNA-binding NarL/FixJ family response regulator
MNKIKVSYIEDKKAIREAIVLLLTQFSDIEVLSTYESPNSFVLDKIMHDQIDVLLLDMEINDVNDLGLDALNYIKESNLKINVIVFSGRIQKKKKLLSDAIELGAKGCLDKDNRAEFIAEAIRLVHKGEKNIFCKKIIDTLALPDKNTPIYEQLTEREKNIFKMVAKGNDKYTIAEILKIDVRTVERHKSNINKKFYISRDIEYLLKSIELSDEEVLGELGILTLQ